MGAVDLRDLLEIQVEVSGQLIVESRGMMTSSIQSVLESREVTRILMREGSKIVGPKVHYLLKQICTNTEQRLLIRPFVLLGVLVGRYLKITVYVSSIDSSDVAHGC